MPVTHRHNLAGGFTLIELAIVIVIVGILSAVAMQKMSVSVQTAQYEQTKAEMDQLAMAVMGNPATYNDGSRADFGYVGDVGAMPPNLDALAQNPGGFSTWQGPYVASGFAVDDFKKDAWGSAYSIVGMLLRSTGSGANIDKELAASAAVLLNNSIEGVIVDADRTPPGPTYRDSISVRLSYPDGAGGLATASITPSANGSFAINNLPIGNRTLRVIYLPTTDTVMYPVTIYPARTVRLDIIFPTDLW
ncbi:MAG: prepilin-type N-terminal cleavage/methylation domain-containing protein [Candidatus Zixiibacteriota bacterium]